MSDLITINTTIKDQVAEALDFGTPLIVGYHNNYADRVREYNVRTYAAELVADGFTADQSDAIYQAAVALAGSNAEGTLPPTFKVGRRAGQSQRLVRLIPTAVDATVYSGKLNGTVWTFTSVDAVLANILAGIEAAIVGVGAAVTTDDTSGTHLDITGNVADEWFTLRDLSHNFTISDETPLPGTDIQTDLAAIYAEDPDWYGLIVADARSKVQVVDADVFARGKSGEVLYIPVSNDTAVANGTASNVALTIQALTSHETGVMYGYATMGYWPEAAWFAVTLPKPAGRISWAAWTLTGVPQETVTSITSSQRSNLATASVNYYAPNKGLGWTRNGWAASGRYFDLTRGKDSLNDELDTEISTVLANANKVPYTRDGFALIMGVVRGVLDGYAEGTDPFLVKSSIQIHTGVPSDQTSAEKAARSYTVGTWQATAAGAIHNATITGVITI